MESGSGYAKARKNCPAHTGVTQDIRHALQRAGEPVSAYKLSLLTGRKPEQIKNALIQSCCKTGGIKQLLGPKCVLYALYEHLPPAPPPPPGKRAGVITIGRGSRWYSGLV